MNENKKNLTSKKNENIQFKAKMIILIAQVQKKCFFFILLNFYSLVCFVPVNKRNITFYFFQSAFDLLKLLFCGQQNKEKKRDFYDVRIKL